MNQKQIGIGATAIAAIAVAAGFLLRPAPDPVVAVGAPAATAPHAPGPMAVQPSQTDAPALAATTASSSSAGASKAAEFNRLIQTGKPVDALTAYKLAAGCEGHKAWAALAKQAPLEDQRLFAAQAPKDPCGDLSPGQIATRLELLRIALDAGVHGALAALVSTEGPHGVLHTIADGPQWRALENAAIAAGEKSADPYTLLSRSSFYMNCHNTGQPCETSDADKAKALMYWVAFQEAKKLDKMPPAMSSGGSETLVDRYSKSLPPEVAQKAIDEGKTLVATARRPQ
jgi:hypothetical protein